NKSRIFRVDECPVHDGQLRHHGLDTLLDLQAEHDIKFYRTLGQHPWGGPAGIIDADDVVLIKVNCQWKCRGTTNTDVLRGLIHRILKHPDGFQGEIIIFENGQGQGSFDGDPNGWGNYASWPEIDNGIWINAEEENLLTVDYLVDKVFKNDPVSSYLLDPVRANFISSSDHTTDGYRKVSDVSYPCFSSAKGNRIELREGIWTVSGYDSNLKLINVPVLKHHGGTGITGTLKHSYGILSMADGSSGIRHYSESGTQCGKMWSLVRSPDLNILDCIWVSHQSLSGYPPNTTHRSNILLAGIDPVALDYHASKHVLYPLGGSNMSEHNPDTYAGLINHLAGARDFINTNGGIGGQLSHTGDENIEVISTEPKPVDLALIPRSLAVLKGGELIVKAVFVNNTGEQQTIRFATKVTLPNGSSYPFSDYLYGLVQITLNPYELKYKLLSHTMPTKSPSGLYSYHGYIGKPGVGLIDKYTFDFEVA
ncbi:MAG: DUF362 domain-containing protein, partial [Candidatus Aminicenantes bacterium]|nr:DUF362 domain-containing protein [Candidatus Aminicenantes bacterium]